MNPLKTATLDGYKVEWKDDGTDYPALWLAFREGRLPGLTPLHTKCPERKVFRLETERGPLLLKKDWEKDPRFEKNVWRFIAGPWYSRLIRLTNRAINQGCAVVQDAYLVAEKMKGHFATESWLIAEFVEGTPLSQFPRSPNLLSQMAQAVAELHSYGLASNDIHGGNFIVTENGGIKIIDLSLTSPLIICQANDILKLKHAFNMDVPVHGFWRKLLAALMRWKYNKHVARRKRRGE